MLKTGNSKIFDNKAIRLYNKHMNLTKGTKMTLKQKAMIQTLAIFISMILTSVLLNVILMYASIQAIQYTCGAILIGFLVYGVYGVVLSRLEYDAKLEQLSSKT